MSAKVILNPYSARWTALRRQPEAEAALKGAGVDYELVATGQPGDGLRLAAEAVRAGFSPIIAAGGDGHIGEVVNGIAQASGEDPWPALGILPLGTANDLVDNLGLPRDLEAAARVIHAGVVEPLDVCQVNGRYFVNNAALGLEPTITIIQQDMTRVRGVLRYLIAALVGIAHNPQWTMTLAWDSGGEYQGPATLVSVGNCPRTGGVFYIVPHADPVDGRLTFIHGFLPTRMQILALLPRTMNPAGRHIEHPDVHEIHATWLKVHIEPESPLHADGEIVSAAVQEAEFRLVPARLNLLVGAHKPSPPATL